MLLIRGSPAVLPVGKSGSKSLFAPPPLQRLRVAPFRPVKLERRHAFLCRAEDGRNSAVTDIRKIDTEKGSLQHQLRETVLTPETLVPVVLGVGGALLAGYGQDGAVIGEAWLLRYKLVLGRRSSDLRPTVLCDCRRSCWCCYTSWSAAVPTANGPVHIPKAHIDIAGGH